MINSLAMESDLEIGQYRLLEVDNPVILPEDTHVRFIVTSSDVLHDFALPAAGIKMDAAPGDGPLKIITICLNTLDKKISTY